MIHYHGAPEPCIDDQCAAAGPVDTEERPEDAAQRFAGILAEIGEAIGLGDLANTDRDISASVREVVRQRDRYRAQWREARAELERAINMRRALGRHLSGQLDLAHAELERVRATRLPDAETLARARYDWRDLTESERASAVEEAADMLELLQRAMDRGESSGEVPPASGIDWFAHAEQQIRDMQADIAAEVPVRASPPALSDQERDDIRNEARIAWESAGPLNGTAAALNAAIDATARRLVGQRDAARAELARVRPVVQAAVTWRVSWIGQPVDPTDLALIAAVDALSPLAGEQPEAPPC